MKYFHNTNWIFLEKIFTLFVINIVNLFAIRYLGPENFGTLNYFLTIVQLILPFIGFGINSIVLRDIIKDPTKEVEYVINALTLKIGLGVITYLLVLTVVILFFPNKNEALIFCILSTTLILNSALIFESYFMAKIKAKTKSISKILSLSISSLLKIYFIYIEAELVYFAVVVFVETIVYVSLLTIFFLKERNVTFNLNAKLMRKFITTGFPYMLENYSMIILKKVDIIVIEIFYGFYIVGIYSVAVLSVNLITMVPMVILSSIFPKLVKEHMNNNLDNIIFRLYRVFIPAAFLLAITFSSLSDVLISSVFGDEYLESINIFSIYVWSCVFMTIHFINNKWFFIQDKRKEFFVRALVGALLNIVLSIVLAINFGIEGVAYGTLISFSVLSYFSLFFTSDGKKLLKIMHKSLTTG